MSNQANTTTQEILQSLASGTEPTTVPRTTDQQLMAALASAMSGQGAQKTTMSTASADSVGKIYQYIGDTTDDYTQGYFYKGTASVVNESITAVEDDDMGTLDITGVNSATVKSKLQPGTHEFEMIGYPSKITFMNVSTFPPASLVLTRDATFDNSVLGIYSWVDGANNFYITTTKNPGLGAKVYNYDIQTGDTTEAAGYTLTGISERSATSGFWRLLVGNSYEIAEPYDYGISMSSSGFPGNKIKLTYTEASTTYSWSQINTQPSGT